MEKRINDKARTYVTEFKDAIRARVLALNFGEEAGPKVNDLLELVVEYDRLCYDKDDFIKRKRVKNSIPTANRCVAKRANGEQCTRKRRADCEFCGTHYKSTPHGSVSENAEVAIDESLNAKQRQIEVVAEDIGGIVYYLDAFGNVYNTEDVIRGKENPQIVAKYTKKEGKFQIPEFGLM